MKKLIEHDGNGSITMNTWMAITTFILLILTSISSVVVLGVNAQNDIQENTDKVLEQAENIKQVEELVIDHEKRMTVTETHYDHIVKILDRIEEKIG